jgi:DNA-binding transcriptional ArsR family regulator
MAKGRIDPRAVSDPRRIRVLASPVRHELVDTLSALGGKASVAALAEQLGRHADGLYYHLRVLCKAGLVEEIEGGQGAERLYRLAGTGRAPLRLAYRAGRGGNTSALSNYAHGLLQVAERDFKQALEIPGVVVSGERRQLWAARNKGWVSGAELEEVNRLLERLCALTSKPRAPGCDSLLSLAFVLAPLSRRSKRRGHDV